MPHKPLSPETLVRRAYSGKLFPSEQINMFRNMDKIFPTRTISRGSQPEIKPSYKEIDFSKLTIAMPDGDFDLYDYVAHNNVSGILVMNKGEIALEHYENGNNERTRWLSMSVAKSISSTLVGAAIEEGLIDSVNDQLVKYLPVFLGTSYDGVCIKDLLQMTSGIAWNEDYTNPLSDRRCILDLQLQGVDGAILEFMARLPRIADPGTVWNYNTGETYIIGSLIKAATGAYLADYLSHKIWSKLGMEADATWWLERQGGLEIAGSGISATLRDYAKLARFFANDGVIDGQRILPKNWMLEAASSREISGDNLDYGYMWWVFNPSERESSGNEYSARGIFGQYIYINQTEDIIVVVWSSRPKPSGPKQIFDNNFFNAIVDTIINPAPLSNG